MDARKDDPSGSGLTLYDGRSAIRIFAHYAAPSGKLRTVVPELIKLAIFGVGNFNRRASCALAIVVIDVKPHTRREIQPVVDRVSAEPTAGANPQVMQT